LLSLQYLMGRSTPGPHL